MSSLYAREGRWYVQFTDRSRDPQKRRFSLNTENERTARRLQARADHLYESGAWDPWKTDLDRAFPEGLEKVGENPVRSGDGTESAG